MPPIGRRGVKTEHGEKYCFSLVKLNLFDVGLAPLFSIKSQRVSSLKGLSKGGLGGALGASWDAKMRNRDQKCIFKFVKQQILFYRNSGQVASPEHANCDRRSEKSEVGGAKWDVSVFSEGR